MKYYRHFLIGFLFVLGTDHAVLTHLMRTPHPVAQSARHLDTLTECQFMVQYRPGVSHHNADALSRRPCKRELNAHFCKQCGTLLEPIDEGPEGEDANVKEEGTPAEVFDIINPDVHRST